MLLWEELLGPITTTIARSTSCSLDARVLSYTRTHAKENFPSANPGLHKCLHTPQVWPPLTSTTTDGWTSFFLTTARRVLAFGRTSKGRNSNESHCQR